MPIVFLIPIIGLWALLTLVLYITEPRFVEANINSNLSKAYNPLQCIVKNIVLFPFLMLTMLALLLLSLGCAIMDIFAKDYWRYGLRNWKLVKFRYKRVLNPNFQYYFEPIYIYRLEYKDDVK